MKLLRCHIILIIILGSLLHLYPVAASQVNPGKVWIERRH